MTLAISTSSPQVSVAVIDGDQVLVGLTRLAPGSASMAVSELTEKALTEAGMGLKAVTRVAVDVGPGGFTSTRVGVTFAKTLAWANELPIIAASSFDLIDSTQSVAVPSKRGVWLLRVVGSSSFNEVTSPPDACGYGLGSDDVFPDAARFAVLRDVSEASALTLSVLYGAEPSISKPKDSRVLPGAS